MPRKPREKSSTGIYHVMLRGVNRQNIFFVTDDFELMKSTLIEAQYHKDENGVKIYDDCFIYAYCIMNNHVHILIKEGTKTISNIMKRIEDRFAVIYNNKNDRVGHVFQGRFRSEPVNDIDYFHILLRYIHRNPVKGMECNTPEEYPHSSWREYMYMPVSMPVILPEAYNFVDKYFDRNDLVKWVNMNINDECMDMDSEKFTLSDNTAWEILSDISGEKSPVDFMGCPKDFQLHCILEAIDAGITIAQASRLSTLSRQMIKNSLYHKKEFDSSKLPLQYKSILDNTRAISTSNKVRMLSIISLCTELHRVRTKDVSMHLNLSDSLSRKLLSLLTEYAILCKDGSTHSATYKLNSPQNLTSGSDPDVRFCGELKEIN